MSAELLLFSESGLALIRFFVLNTRNIRSVRNEEAEVLFRCSDLNSVRLVATLKLSLYFFIIHSYLHQHTFIMVSLCKSIFRNMAA